MTPRQRVPPTQPELGQAPFVTLPEPDVLRARLASVLGRLRSPSDSLLLPRVPESAQDAADLAGHHLHLRRRLVLGLEYRGYFILTDTTDPAAAFTSEATTYAVRKSTRFLFLPRAR